MNARDGATPTSFNAKRPCSGVADFRRTIEKTPTRHRRQVGADWRASRLGHFLDGAAAQFLVVVGEQRFDFGHQHSGYCAVVSVVSLQGVL